MRVDCSNRKFICRSGHDAQRGATLLVSLMLLLGLTVVGIASMRETVVQQKVVSAALEDDTAFQSAEFALRAGEQFVLQYTRSGGQRLMPGPVGGTLDVFDRRELTMEWWKQRNNAAWDSGTAVTTYPRLNASSQRLPSYVIEVLGEDGSGGSVELGNKDSNTVMNYRITARGFGVNDAYYTVLQTTIGVQY